MCAPVCSLTPPDRCVSSPRDPALLNRGACESVTIPGAQLGPQDGYRELYRLFCTIVGGVQSPTLFNVYLDCLDKFITTDILPDYNRGKRRTPYRPYMRLHLQITRLEQKGHKEEALALRTHLQRLPSRDPDDPDYRRLRYVRYADFGINQLMPSTVLCRFW